MANAMSVMINIVTNKEEPKIKKISFQFCK